MKVKKSGQDLMWVVERDSAHHLLHLIQAGTGLQARAEFGSQAFPSLVISGFSPYSDSGPYWVSASGLGSLPPEVSTLCSGPSSPGGPQPLTVLCLPGQHFFFL